MSARDYFLGKRIAVIGLGPHGEMLADIRSMVKWNALVSVYDLRSESKLAAHIPALRSFGLANQVLGAIPAEDLMDMDLIILSHEYSRSSSFLTQARTNGIDIEYPETLFLKHAPPITVVGIMGACGTSTVLSMLVPLVEAACAGEGSQSSIVLDPDSGDGILSQLRKAVSGDIALMRIVPAMMGEIAALSWSPQIAIFTTVPPAYAYRESPFEIIAHQTYTNSVIGDDRVIDAFRASGFQSRAKLLRTKGSIVPDDWLPHARSPHDRDDAALALQAARLFKVFDEAARDAFMRWKPLKARLEPVKKVKGVEFVNDGASVIPAATVASLSAVSRGRDLVIIMGGADHGADCRELFAAVRKLAHTVVVVPGSGTLRERRALAGLEDVAIVSVPTLEEAVRQALDHARKGDTVLFSPAFGAAGIDASRMERAERFVRAVRAL